MRTSTMRSASVLLCALGLALGCEAPTLTCPEGTRPEDDSCVPIAGDGEVPAPDGGPAMDAATPMDAAAPPMPDGGPMPMPDSGPPPLPDAGPPTCPDPDLWFRDLDMDGQGDPSASVESCDPIDGFVLDSRDCDDRCDTCYVGAAEVCDGRDNDCDGSTDEGATTTYYLDADGDGHGNPAISMDACSAPSGYVAAGDDCDDTCSVCWTGASESCDGEDNDCDGSTDEGVSTTYYLDADGDGHGNPAISMSACAAPSGYVSNGGDCDDTCSVCWTGASETCDGRDNDCDGSTDEGVTTTYYLDADGDGRGDPARTSQACSAPTGHVDNADDCDDSCSACWTGASETCDGRDNDCDGSTDEGVTTRYYRDVDGDGYGQPGLYTDACSVPSGYVANADDCNDACATCNPGASEVCDDRDNDCDGAIDDGVRSTFYRDSDGDGYGDPSVRSIGCTAPSGYVADATDCNDACATCHPGATETCDGRDNDCDMTADEGVTTTYYRDADGDGYGVSTTTVTACSAPSGYVATSGDCNDASASIHPGRTEVCNAIDDDCDGVPDETFACVRGAAVTCTTSCGSTGSGLCSSSCTLPSGSSCNPPAEVCNYADDDCDGVRDESLFSAGTPRVDAYASDFDRPETLRIGTSLYSFWVSADSVHAWRLGLDGAPVAGAAQVPIGGRTRYDVDGSPSGLGFAFVDAAGTSTGSVVVRRLSTSTFGTMWSRTLSVSASDVRIAVGSAFVFVFTREGLRIRRYVLQLSDGAPVGSAVDVGETVLPYEVTDDDLTRQYLVSIDTTLRAVDLTLISGTTAPTVSTRSYDFGEIIWDLAVAADWSVTSGNPPVVVAAMTLGTSTNPARLYTMSYANGSSRVVQTLANVTGPGLDAPYHSRLDLEYADGIYLLGAVETTTIPTPTTGTPRVYQLTRSGTSSTLSVRSIGTGLPVSTYTGVSVVRFPDSYSYPDRLFYNPSVNGIASLPIGCY